jgi:plastocyanin
MKKGKIQVGGGQVVLAGLTPAVGKYPIECSRRLHKGFGMGGKITVTW